MRTSLLQRYMVLVLAAMFAMPTGLLARDNKDTSKKDTDATTTSTMTPKGKLSEEENPLLIGKRNINKHQATGAQRFADPTEGFRGLI